MGRLLDAASSAIWWACRLLPVDGRKVVLCSYYGRSYSDSPKAIAQALLDSGERVKIQWLVSGPQEADGLPAEIEPVPYRGWRRIYALSTAKVWVDNCRKYDRFKKRNQYYMQTWHGFALKRIEADVSDALEPEYIRGCKMDSAHCDVVVSNSSFMTGLYRHSFWYDGPVEEFGTPRNDVFFQPPQAVREKVRAFFNLEAGQKLLLYAPTFRADHTTDAYGLDAAAVLAACQKRFGGEWSALIRLHPNVAAQSAGLFDYDGRRILNATDYPDMQELLCAADCLITDYSSSMFDFALSGKPCLQFATDIEDYRKDRNFYFPVDQLPFPLATGNEPLARAIEAFDEAAYHRAWADFAGAQGIHEDGRAAERCAQWILERLD